MSSERTKFDQRFIFNEVYDKDGKALRVYMNSDLAIAIDQEEDTIATRAMYKEVTVDPGQELVIDVRGFKTLSHDGDSNVTFAPGNNVNNFKAVEPDLDEVMKHAHVRVHNGSTSEVYIYIKA